MEPQIWSNSGEKRAYFLVLRGQEVHSLKVTGSVLTLKRKAQSVLDGLQQGQDPANVGASSVETLDTRSISKAQVDPGNTSLTLYGGPDGSKSLSYTPAENNADEILKAILAQSGSTFEPAEEEIGVVEALIPPVIVGVIGGGFWMGAYQAAGKMAAGEAVDVEGRRGRGLQRILIWVVELIGMNGTIAVGVLLLALVLGWATKRIVHRPKRTVWLRENA
jgi:hypothetical protein